MKTYGAVCYFYGMPYRPAVYCILNVINGKRYIGSSVDAPRRLYVHRWLLRKGKHYSVQLQHSWERDGEASFSFAVIEFCKKEHLLAREQIWMNAARSYDSRFGYNTSQVAGTREGVPQPITVADRLRQVHAGKPKSVEHRAKIGAANRGKVRTRATRKKISETVARSMTPERRIKQAEYGQLAAPAWKGKSLSDDHRSKIQAAHLARWAGVPRMPRKKRPRILIPLDQRKKTGPRKGTPRPGRTLTPDQVRTIRAAKAAGEICRTIADRFGVGRKMINKIILRQRYADIE